MNQNKRNSWNYILLGTILITFVLVFLPVWGWLINIWSNSDDYSHGFFILPISLYIIWMKKDELADIETNPSLIGLALMIISLLLYILGQYGSILTLSPITMIFFIISCIVYLYGFTMVQALIFPLFFLFLMIPIPTQIYSALTIPLQLFVTQITVELARCFSIPILREGNVIQLADTTLQVVNACSGLRSIISLFALCTIFGYFTLKSNILRVILCSSCVFIAIFINIIRVLSMVLSHHYFHYDLTHGPLHTAFGVFIFCFSLIAVYIIQLLLSYGEKQFVQIK